LKLRFQDGSQALHIFQCAGLFYDIHPVGAAEGCDLLIFFFKIKIKRSQPSAVPTGLALSMLSGKKFSVNAGLT
jgi:hypothetical protein